VRLAGQIVVSARSPLTTATDATEVQTTEGLAVDDALAEQVDQGVLYELAMTTVDQ